MRVHAVGLGDRLHRHRRRTARASTRVRADRGRPRSASTPEHGRRHPRRHGHRPVRPRHLRLALAGRRRRVASPARRARSPTRRSKIAAHLLEAAPEDIELADGKFSVKGSPDKGMTLAEVAGAAYIPENLPEGMEPGLEETTFYDPENFVFPFGAHACIVDVDAETGQGRRRPLRRGRRLRPGDQPEADRRPGPRRHRRTRSARRSTSASTTTRTASSSPARSSTTRCPSAADVPSLRDRPHGDPVAGQLARRQGRRRGGHDRRVARGGQRGHRRAAPARRHVHQHAAARSVWRDPGGRGTSGGVEHGSAAVRTHRRRGGGCDPRGVRLRRARVARRGAGRAARRRRGRQAPRRRALADPADEAAAGGAVAARRPAQGARACAAIQRENGDAADRRDDAATPSCGQRAARASRRRSAATIADQQVRNRGTIGGSLAHGDPASDLPAVLLAAEGSVTVRGARRRARGRGGRPLPGLPDDRRRPRTRSSPRSALPALEGYGLRLPEVQPPPGGLGDGRPSCALRQARGRRLLRGRAHRAHPHGLDAAAGDRRGGRRCAGSRSTPTSIAAAAEQAAEGTDPPADLNATRGLQAPPGARAHAGARSRTRRRSSS